MTPQDLAEKDGIVATLPEIIFQLKEVLDDPDSSYHDLEPIILNDPALTARLLRIVNSAFYGFSEPVETVTHAVSVVGMTQLHELALSTVVMNQFKGVPKNILNMRSFWEHGIACGLATRTLAMNSGEENPEKFFVAGLLHDIGLLVLAVGAPKRLLQAIHASRDEEIHLFVAERQIWGFDHGDVGEALLKRWNLPPVYQECVACHHKPGQAEKYPLEVAYVHTGEFIANTLELGNSGENSEMFLDEKARKKIGIGENIIMSSIMKDVVKGFEDATSAFLAPV